MKKCIVCGNELQGNQKMYCSANCKQKAHWYKFKEQSNSYHSQTKRALKRKLVFIQMLGGKCSICGYDKNMAALEFHHRDSNEKNFPLSVRELSNTREDLLLEELKKCDLICSNCHKEKHYPEMDILNVKKILDS